MRKNILLIVAAVVICLGLAPQIFGLETTPVQAVACNETSQLLSFEEAMESMPAREIPAADMPMLKNLYNDIAQTEQANQQAEANKKLDDFCFKIATYPYTVSK